MSKKLAITEERLRKAHGFIRGLARRAENYGSSFSSDVFHDCTNFMRDNKAVREAAVIVITRERYRRLVGFQLDALRAGLKAGKATK